MIYVAANLDDLFILVGFFAHHKMRVRYVAIGQYLGLTALFAICAATSLLSLVLKPQQLGLLGVLPIALGLQKLWKLWIRRNTVADADLIEVSRRTNPVGKTLSVVAVTIANSSDGLGIWSPVFATLDGARITLFGVVFAVMTAAWLLAAGALARHPALGSPIRRYAHFVVPFILISLGTLIIAQAGAWRIFA